MSETKIITTSKLSWLNIINPTEKEIEYLRKKYKFSMVDLEDSSAIKHAQRPKIHFRSNYIFMILLFPVYNRSTREIKQTEIDFFITKDHVITLHNNRLKPFRDFFETCQEDPAEKDLYIKQSPDMLLYEILDRIYHSIFPMLDHLSLNINNIENNIFNGNERDMVKEVLIIKRNIVYFRKIMQVHKNILKKLNQQKLPYFYGKEKSTIFYNNLIDQTKHLWDLLENYQQTIQALEDTNNSLVTFRLNDIMKTLTMISVVVLPLTFIAAIFTMSVKWMPIRDSYLDWHKIVVIMLIVAGAMIYYFKRKKWL